ncbi:MAG: hypothetical protein RML56_14780 [Burkholderiales bacterium]|nr:hypothetical protein [Burkholderiales bacterium]
MLRRRAKLRLRFGIAAPKVAGAAPRCRGTCAGLCSRCCSRFRRRLRPGSARTRRPALRRVRPRRVRARARRGAKRSSRPSGRNSRACARPRTRPKAASRWSARRRAKLAQQIRSLEHENARLREELAIFEAMASSDAPGGSALSILRFKVEPEALPGEYRYRLLLRAPLARRGKEFQGRVELLVNLTENGRSAIIKLPDAKDADSAGFRLSFKHFQRVEGLFRVSPNAKVESVQVRVYESGSDVVLGTRTANVG